MSTGKTTERLQPPLTPELDFTEELIAAGRELARQQIRERCGQNVGEPFDTWNLSAGVAVHSPYCVSLWHYQAGELYKRLGVDPPFHIGASTSLLALAAKKAGRFHNSQGAARGRLALFYHPDGHKYYHVGLLLESLGGGRWRTAEGNTSVGEQGSQDNGNGIFLRTRNWRATPFDVVDIRPD